MIVSPGLLQRIRRSLLDEGFRIRKAIKVSRAQEGRQCIHTLGDSGKICAERRIESLKSQNSVFPNVRFCEQSIHKSLVRGSKARATLQDEHSLVAVELYRYREGTCSHPFATYFGEEAKAFFRYSTALLAKSSSRFLAFLPSRTPSFVAKRRNLSSSFLASTIPGGSS